uniref:Putative secreted protein n=1 Tax=Ixodes ricinus TaxID=34613 RepID=A0A6B0TVI0_IXORI
MVNVFNVFLFFFLKGALLRSLSTDRSKNAGVYGPSGGIYFPNTGFETPLLLTPFKKTLSLEKMATNHLLANLFLEKQN